VARYIAWRAALVPLSLLLASALVFLALMALPGDVVHVIAGDAPATPRIQEALREELGLDRPLYEQYRRWLLSVVSGEPGGRSLETREPVRSIIARQLPTTLLLAIYTVVLSMLVSFPLGVMAAVRRNRWPDYLVRLLTLASMAMPDLLVALFILLGLLLVFQWSPPIIYAAPWTDPWRHALIMVWPAVILSWEYSAHIIRVTRAGMISAFSQTFITSARAKGLTERNVVLRHALRNAMVPSLTVFGLQFGRLLSGALVLETVFGLPGIGRGLVQAGLARDYPVVLALASLLVFISLIVSLVVDVLYAYFDPRISHTA